MKLGQSGEAYDSTQIPEAAAAVASGGSIRRMQGQCARGSETNSRGAGTGRPRRLSLAVGQPCQHYQLQEAQQARSQHHAKGKKSKNYYTWGRANTAGGKLPYSDSRVFGGANKSPGIAVYPAQGPSRCTADNLDLGAAQRYFIAASKRKMFLPTGKHLSSYKTTSTCPLKCGG